MASTTPEPDPMPVFAIQASDNIASVAIGAYIAACCDRDLFGQAQEVIAAFEEINAWRERHPDRCKWPDHEHVPAGQPGSGSES